MLGGVALELLAQRARRLTRGTATAGCSFDRGAGLDAPVSVAGLGAPAHPHQASGIARRACGPGVRRRSRLAKVYREGPRAAPGDLRPNEALKLAGLRSGIVRPAAAHYGKALQLSAGR